MNIYVGNLPFDTTEDELKNLFSQYGEVLSVKMITNRFTGKSRGFAFVDMPNNEEALSAIQGLNKKEFKGRNLKVDKARPPRTRPNRGKGEFRKRF